MSTEATRLVVDYLRQQDGLGVVERFTLVLLADHVNGARGDWQVWPGLAILAAALGVSRDTARRALRSLVERRLLTEIAAGVGRGHPTVYRLEKVALCNLLPAQKRSQLAAGKGSKTGPLVKQPEVLREPETKDAADQSAAAALAQVWNDVVTKPIPKVRLPLSPDRVRAYAKAWRSLSPEDWRTICEQVNGQDWCRAPGTGDHPGWVASLDYLTRKPAVWLRHLERAQTGRGRPTSRSDALAQVRAANVAQTAASGLFMAGQGAGSEDEDADATR